MTMTYCTVQAVDSIIVAQQDADCSPAVDVFHTKVDVPLWANSKGRLQACMANVPELQSVRQIFDTLGIRGIYDEAAN